jgi:hypothetical protein
LPICVTCDNPDKSIVAKFEQLDKKESPIRVTCDKADKSIVAKFEQPDKKR